MRFSAVFLKELILISRDKRALLLTAVFPVFMLILYTYGVAFNLEEVKVAALDYCQSPQSRELIHKLNSSRYLDVAYNANSYNDVEKLMIENKIVLAFVFPPDFEQKLKSGKKTTVQVIANGSDANTANVSLGFQAAIFASYGTELMLEKLKLAGNQNVSSPKVTDRTRLWYNPELKSTFFIAPGVIAVVSMLLGSLLTATSLVREKETGTLEMLASTPINSFELILGKITPYLIVAFADVVLIIIITHFAMGVPINGSAWLLLGSALIFLVCALAIGLFASAVADTISIAQFVVIFASFLPSVLLSGFIFPIESMPRFVQMITYIVPARHFIIILRGIFLKGAGVNVLWPQFLFLIVFGFFVMVLSAKKFKKKLD